ncbi:matrixin family metalloprotease [Frigoribacterium faeni]|uniref:Peptidase M10 metallopeptidase domain-containing protein n=1 Tax=Frigoribacterium faeni TaxID=145483 RepID=A0A7W3JK48_9MICO|nr:matrixin family metalloprotease [Frigoribacterium faeni]MBA8814313.1 hypothetical protein [Frigoribacterium faeni]GEK83253.1 hypothetical protein FFA01_15620 [Frigoribacterium faeni]
MTTSATEPRSDVDGDRRTASSAQVRSGRRLVAGAATLLLLVTAGVVGGGQVAQAAGTVACSATGAIDASRTAALRSDCAYDDLAVTVGTGRTVPVPDPGTTLAIGVVMAAGADELPEVSITRDDAGRVAVAVGEKIYGDPTAAQSLTADTSAPAAPQATPGCGSTTAYSKSSSTWPGALSWYLNGTSQPHPTAASTSVRWGAYSMASKYTRCGYQIKTRATSNYVGTTRYAVGVTTSGGCSTNSDGRNTVGYKALPAGVLGLTCVLYTPARAIEADIAFTTKESFYVWSGTGACKPGQYDLRTTAAHEFGHALGLGHTGANSGQIMQPSIGSCDFSTRLKGSGDAAAMAKLYPLG